MPDRNDTERLRQLEGWLPLAQTLSEEGGWGACPAELERLILRASAALERVATLAEARAILAWYHTSTSEDIP